MNIHGMRMNTARTMRYIGFMLALFVAAPAFAQTPSKATSALPETQVSVPTPPSGLTSCFDVYRFGSVVTSVTPSLSTVAQDATVVFKGTVQNQNAYPIDDVTLYIKIFHDRTEGQKNINGPDVVDWFPAVEHFTLKAGETKSVSFSWHVPSDAQPGTYEAASYVSSSHRFELSGLSFTDDITGSMARFTVVGSDVGAVRFEKSAVSVNGNPFYFAAFPPMISSSTPLVPVSAVIDNTKKTAATVSVHWQVYYWDALQQSHLLEDSTQSVALQPNATTSVSYTVKDTNHSTYYVLGTLTDQYGSKSIIGVRYGHDHQPDDTRFNFVGISAFPAVSGKGEAIACVHSTTGGIVPDSKVVITATTNEFLPFLSRTIAHASWVGSLSGNIYALAAPFTGSASSFTLTAQLYQAGTLVDTVSLPYQCSDLGISCGMSVSEEALIGLGILLVLISGVVLIRYRSSLKRKADPLV